MQPKKLARRIIPKKGVRVAEEAYRRSRMYTLQARYGFPARKLRVIAVTGTNGKTTTCSYINEILKAAGHKTALYTTAVIEIAGKAQANHTHRTLPLTGRLLSFLKKVRRADVDYLILEVTSQALDQHKLLGIPIEVAVLTNLSQDHLDYHGTMNSYAAAKARLFNDYMNPNHCVLNADDERYDYFLEQSVGQAVSYGKTADSTERIKAIKHKPAGVRWNLHNGDKVMDLQIPQAGEFNVYNASAAATAALTLQIKPKAIAKGLAKAQGVAGRMESVEAGQPFTVWIDYAITPDAIEKVLVAARQKASKNGKVHIVFGATGDRDRSKRPEMGRIAAKHADFIYLTDDETYSEDPQAIRDAVKKGISKAATKKLTETADRKKAIKQALQKAKEGDVVVVTGIGHQNARNMGGKDIPWNERKTIEKLLK